jgi:hypothetical protein
MDGSPKAAIQRMRNPPRNKTNNANKLNRAGLIIRPAKAMLSQSMPNAQVTLNAEQIDDLNEKLSHMRHEINNQLSLVVAAMELIRLKPELREKMIDTVSQQPPKISAEVARFSSEFERALGITR